MKYMNFFELKGKTLTNVSADEGDGDVTLRAGSESFLLWHQQDCCESVHLEKIIGDVNNLIGSPITLAEDDHPGDPDWSQLKFSESHTWSQFILETAKGRVEFWFLGESNGYYSEEVSFRQTD